MAHHAIFGGTLEADLAFPELRPTPARTPSWRLRTVHAPPPPASLELLGRDEPDESVVVRLFRAPHGYRLVFDDTGTFDVSARGDSVTWYPAPGAPVDIARSDVMGRVLAVALHAAGLFCLHGSAVAIDGRVVVFVAPKFHGKSTTALALTRAGAQLVSDDAVAIEICQPPLVRPGVHTLRVFPDSARRAGGRQAVASGFEAKETVHDLDESSLMLERAPLDALYVLDPVARDDAARADGSAARVPLRGAPAALALVTLAKIGALLGGTETATLLDRASALARSVPVYSLHVVRDFDRLPDAVARVMAWHQTDRAVAAVPGAGP